MSSGECGTKEFCRLTGIKYRTLMRMLGAGKVPGAYRNGPSGREWVIPRSSAEKVKRALREEGKR